MQIKILLICVIILSNCKIDKIPITKKRYEKLINLEAYLLDITIPYYIKSVYRGKKIVKLGTKKYHFENFDIHYVLPGKMNCKNKNKMKYLYYYDERKKLFNEYILKEFEKKLLDTNFLGFIEILDTLKKEYVALMFIDTEKKIKNYNKALLVWYNKDVIIFCYNDQLIISLFLKNSEKKIIKKETYKILEEEELYRKKTKKEREKLIDLIKEGYFE